MPKGKDLCAAVSPSGLNISPDAVRSAKLIAIPCRAHLLLLCCLCDARKT